MCGRAYDPRFLFTWPEREVRGDGPAAARRRAVDRGPRRPRRRGARRTTRRATPACARWSRSDRGAEPAVLPVRDALRRRRHRPARHPDRARASACRSSKRADPRAPTASASSGCEPMINETARREPGRDRPPGVPHLPRSASRRSPCTPTPTPTRPTCARPTSPSGCRARAGRHLPAHRPARRRRARAGADAVHPGYGFLSENADFARAVLDAGLTWVGPPPESIEAMGSKIEAKRIMREAGVPVLEAPAEPTEADLPLLVKASAGGGGRGMRVVRRLADLAAEVAAAEAEALSAFGDGTVFVEPYVERGRHVEVQVFGTHGVVLGERECSIQRRHQKVLEEAPAPRSRRRDRRRSVRRGGRAAEAIGYGGAGTVEFLVRPGGRAVLVPGDEHPPAGRAPGDRAGVRAGPGRCSSSARDRRCRGVPTGGTRSRCGCTPRNRRPTTSRSPAC